MFSFDDVIMRMWSVCSYFCLQQQKRTWGVGGHSSSGIIHLRAVPQEMLNESIIKIRVRVKITHFRLKPLITYYILQDSDILFNPTNVKCRHVAKNENQGVKVCISSNYKENSNLIFLHAVNTRWQEINIYGCYSPVKIVFVPIRACKNNWQIWCHNASTLHSRDVTDHLLGHHNTKSQKTILGDNGKMSDWWFFLAELCVQHIRYCMT